MEMGRLSVKGRVALIPVACPRSCAHPCRSVPVVGDRGNAGSTDGLDSWCSQSASTARARTPRPRGAITTGQQHVAETTAGPTAIPPEENAADQLRLEQAHVTELYRRLDIQTSRTQQILVQSNPYPGEQARERVEREARGQQALERMRSLRAAEYGLCFGRLDFDQDSGEEPRYIGRVGLRDEDDDYRPLLLDWRAPQSRPYYLATAVSRDGVRRRRAIQTRDRTVVRIDDELLDLDPDTLQAGDSLTGEAALLAAVGAERTGRMGDIVATIQAEQDRIIRSSGDGVLVVQGGPGTGKTAVALHRAAYLLYTRRERLAGSVVLVVGPNPTFLRYVSQVLPSLGETSVLLTTMGSLLPGISAQAWESPLAAEVKGRVAMADMIAAAIRDRQRVPIDAIPIRVDDNIIRLTPGLVGRARSRAQRSGLLHNRARAQFVDSCIRGLARQVAQRIGADPLGGRNLLEEEDVAFLRKELRAEPEIMSAIDHHWPLLSPLDLLADLYSRAENITAAAPWLPEAEVAALVRPGKSPWTPADVPLLDEAYELLGPEIDPDEVARREKQERDEEREYAQGALDIAYGSRSFEAEEGEELSAYDMLGADHLADRQEDNDLRTPVERAAEDREWVFGHLIVDEAQELSEMAWRSLFRRCPTRSMTLVGDVAQTGSAAGTSSWATRLDPLVRDRWRAEALTVNYRTPEEVMTLAGNVLAAVDPGLESPTSVRRSGIEPWRWQVPDGSIADAAGEAVVAESRRLGNGRLAVLCSTAGVADVGAAVCAVVPRASAGPDPDLESPVVVLTVAQAKGLEFDSVLVVDPAALVAETARGLSDLYVALTRPTQRLGIIHGLALPEVLRTARPVAAPPTS